MHLPSKGDGSSILGHTWPASRLRWTRWFHAGDISVLSSLEHFFSQAAITVWRSSMFIWVIMNDNEGLHLLANHSHESEIRQICLGQTWSEIAMSIHLQCLQNVFSHPKSCMSLYSEQCNVANVALFSWVSFFTCGNKPIWQTDG